MNTHAPINLDRYPLTAPYSDAYRELAATTKQALDTSGIVSLPGFVAPASAARAADELLPRFATEAFTHAREHNIYFDDSPRGVAPDHPALSRFTTINHTLCGDQVRSSLVTAVYEFEPFIRFLAQVLGKPALYVMDDALARVNVMAYYETEALNWHFDRSEFTTTLMLQPAMSGGDFEYRTGLRSDTDPNHDGVARLIAGCDDEVQTLAAEAGTLTVFRGKHTAHRTSAVQGARARIMAVFSYYEAPGVQFSQDEQRGFYGRASSAAG